jgi:hypothetical protein
MSWLNYLNPLNWPSDLSNTFIQQLGNGLLYLLASFLDAILNLSGELGNALIGVLETIISGIIVTGEALGPLGLAVMSVGIIGLIGSVFLAFKVARDVPVVGAVV